MFSSREIDNYVNGTKKKRSITVKSKLHLDIQDTNRKPLYTNASRTRLFLTRFKN